MTATRLQFTQRHNNSCTTAGSTFSHLQTTRTLTCDTFNERDFDFPAKSKFKAGQDLLFTRSGSYVIRKSLPADDIWRRPPPNFCPQNFASKPPKRNSRESMQPWIYGTYPGQKTQIQKKQTVSLPKALQPARPNSSKLVNRFRTLDSFEAKRLSAKEGMYHEKKQYTNPKLFDFRQYPALGPLGLPEFDTAQRHDPYNINFKSKNLDTIHGTHQVSPGTRFRGRQMGQAMSPKPQYEPDLIMPRGTWPNPGAEFTRHRIRNRSPHAALLERIEDTLKKQWTRENIEKKRREREWKQHEKERKFRDDIERKLQVHETDQRRRAGPGGWIGRRSQYYPDRVIPKELDEASSTRSSTVHITTDSSNSVS